MWWVPATGVVFGIAGACSPEQYKAEADKEVYQIIDSKWQDGFGHKVNYIINDSNVPASPNDIRIEKRVPSSGVISLAQAIAKLSFFRDIGVLQVRPDGMWEQTSPAEESDSGEPSVEPERTREQLSNSWQLQLMEITS